MTAGARTDETSAGGVVYRVDGGRPLYLLICDSYQNWGFPKGHVEPGEHTEDAALGEVSEGITACRWTAFDEAESLISYANAREILRRANELVGTAAPAP